jgi:hypothetical protein
MNNQRRPIVVQFADNAASIDCEDDQLCRCLAGILAHCRSERARSATVTSSVSFRVVGETPSTWTLWKDDAVVARGLPGCATVERLIYEITVALGTSSQTSPVFHAAGLARGGAGVLLAGESGCGKSTLATRMILEGFDFLSDELVSVDLRAHEMRGFPRPIILKDTSPFEGENWFKRAALPPGHLASTEIVYLNPAQARLNSVRAQARLVGVVFPWYSPADSPEIRSLSRAEGAFRLLHRLVNAETLPRRGFEAVTDLMRSVPAFSIRYAETSQALASIERIVDS